MSLFSDIGNFVSGAVNTVANLATTAASVMFPQAAILSSVTNVLAQGFGGAIGSAVQGLMQGGGMPNFIGKNIMDVVKGVVDQLTQHGNPECDEHVRSQCGNGLQDFFQDFAQKLQQGALQNMRDGEGCEGTKGGKGKLSWYEALAQALGSALDAQTDKIKALSEKVGALNEEAKGIDSSDTKATKQNDSDKASTMTDLQAASQKLSFMMSAASDVLKTIGGALKEIAQKG
ncbi:MAG: hypothetical protein LKCHEGNO_02832 [Burkholderiaceae bacterium]|nr:hypothetical protein [Burkholderiaceae bacterium]